MDETPADLLSEGSVLGEIQCVFTFWPCHLRCVLAPGLPNLALRHPTTQTEDTIMEELFRFIMTRPAQQAKDTSVTVKPHPDYLRSLRAAHSAGGASAVLRVAQAFSASPQALGRIDELKFGLGLRALANDLAPLQVATLDELRKAVKKHLGAGPSDVITDENFEADRMHLGDTVVTAVVLARDEPVSLAEAAQMLRTIALVWRVAASDVSLTVDDGMADARTRSLSLPADPFPLQRAKAQVTPPPPDAGMGRRPLAARRDALLATYNALTSLSPDHLALQDEAPTQDVLERLNPPIALPPVIAPRPVDERASLLAQRPEFALTGLPASPERAQTALLMRREAVSALPEVEREVLAERHIDLTQTSVPFAVNRLFAELSAVEQALADMDAPQAMKMSALGALLVPGAALSPYLPHGGPVSSSVPNSHGSVAPAGIGDLLVVRQFLKRYEAMELGHVENILKGEYKERMHRRARTTEETFTVETEIKKEEERDLQTTERFELKTEASQTLKQDQSLKIGVSVSGSYGPTVEFKASTDFAMSQSKEEASKIATSFSKDVTQRASSKVSERRREERILKTIEVFEEKNTHGMDNKAGAEHVIGQYQWLDKVYEAQVFNYGKRLLFDIMLPEPAAFLMFAANGQAKAGSDLVKPQPFTLSPSDINESNYAIYIKRYEVLGVEPPPQPYITVSRVMDGESPKDNGSSTKSMEVPLADGYQAISGYAVHTFTTWEDSAAVDVVVGKNGHRFNKNSNWGWGFSMANEVGSIPITLKTFRTHVFALAVEIHTQRTARKLDEWKLKTHAAILQGYLKLLRDYEDKLAAAEVQAINQVQGRNPLDNERLIRTEIKKGAISVFTNQHYDLFGAITSSPQGYPQADLPEAAVEGAYIRFFEQAFEWEQMMFFFYPYFWGRKGNWVNRSLLQDVDPLFAEFLKAGAARVVVSVRPGFESAVAHFLDTAQIWNGGELPPITSPLYVSIIEEIRERDKAPGNEVAQGEPWDVRLPTTLVKLRNQASLPEWQKNAQGEWVPV